MSRQRQSLAVRAAQSVVSDLGLRASDPRILRDSNNTVIYLGSAGVVAKVGTSRHRRRLEPELIIGRYLAARNAPIAPPAIEVHPGPHFHSGLTITLWTHYGHGEQQLAAAIADALLSFHKAFLPFDGHLVTFTDHLDEAGRVLDNPSLTPKLTLADRNFLRDCYEGLKKSLDVQPFEMQPLHGEPHLDGNVLCTPKGPLFIDFEAACLGPKEWDLSALPAPVADRYPLVDRPLLDLLSEARSLTVATWCWMQPDRAPEIRDAAHHHLRRLRECR